MKPTIEEIRLTICNQHNGGNQFITLLSDDAHNLALSHYALEKELSQIKTMIEESAAKGRETINRIDELL